VALLPGPNPGGILPSRKATSVESKKNMISNIERYKKDLAQLISDGNFLLLAMCFRCDPKEYGKALKQVYKTKKESEERINDLPSFDDKYQLWYSEALAVIKILLPDRLSDFNRLYEKPKGRKKLTNENYVIEDYLQGIIVKNGLGDIVVSCNAAIPQFKNQLNILKSAQKRFETSLFDIKHLLQADLFDSELDAAKELNKKGFTRGAGAMAGVVLESHLGQICANHKIKVSKKDPTIGDLNDLLKANDVIEISTWRFIHHLGDLRNKCDHKKKIDPTRGDIEELIEGVGKISKTVF
jgi:hypothetical protein